MFYPDASCILKQYGLLKLRDIHILYISLYMYKIMKLGMFSENLISSLLNHSTRTRENLMHRFTRLESIRIDFNDQLVHIWNTVPAYIKYLESLNKLKRSLTHLCRPVRSTFAVRETASLGIMGEPRVPPLNPSESIVL